MKIAEGIDKAFSIVQGWIDAGELDGYVSAEQALAEVDPTDPDQSYYVGYIRAMADVTGLPLHVLLSAAAVRYRETLEDG